MSLKGGIDMYAHLSNLSNSFKRYKSITPATGRKVYFLNDNGYDSERETANKYFKEGQILTIKEIYVGRSSSTVEFEELPDKNFNTVMFEDVEKDLDEVIEKSFVPQTTCSICNWSIAPGDNYCRHCGNKIERSKK